MVGSDPGARSPLAALRIDLERYWNEGTPLRKRIRRLLTCPAIWILVHFRLGCWLYAQPAPVRWPGKLLWRPWNAILATAFDTHIGPGARIGPGLFIGHTGGIWINPGARLGACCNIAQGVVVGAAGGHRAPRIGDRVWIGPHAVVTGSIQVGNDVVIGGNSLVASDLPDQAVAVGVPARVLQLTGSSHLVKVPPSLRPVSLSDT